MDDPIRERLPVSIAGRRYEVDVEGITFSPLGNIAQVQDNQAEPSETSIENDGFWKRTAEDWSLGAAQEYFDLRTDRRPSVRERFRWSRGVDVLSNRRQVSLLPSVSVATTQTVATVGAVVRKADRLYVFNGDAVVHSDPDNPGVWYAGSDSFAAGGLKGIHSVAESGGIIYVADGTNVWDDTAGLATFTSQFNDAGVTGTQYLVAGAGRLLGMAGRDVWEFDATDGTKKNVGGTPGNIFTHDFAGFTWKGGLGTNNGIYIFGDDGTNSEVYFIVPVDATTELAPPYIAHNDLDEGELVRVLRSFGGLLVMGTSLGVRLCTVAGNGTITSGPRIEIGDVLDMHLDGRFVYVTSSTIEDQAGTVDDCGLYVFNLSEFTSPLVPAYASYLLSGSTGTCFSVNRLNNRTVWVQSSNGANEVYVEHATNKVASGQIESGGLTFGVAERIAASSVELQFDPLEAGTSIGGLLRSRKASSDTVTITASSQTNREELVHRFDGSVLYEEPELSITLTRGATVTADVVLRRWTFRALPMLRRAAEIILAIKLHSSVHDQKDTGTPVRLDPLTEYLFLEKLVRDRAIVQIEIGAQKFKARIEGLIIAPGRTMSGFAKWEDAGRNGWMEGVVGVRMITLHDDGGQMDTDDSETWDQWKTDYVDGIAVFDIGEL